MYRKSKKMVDVESSLQMPGMLLVGLRGAWGGNQGAGTLLGALCGDGVGKEQRTL